MLRLGKFIRLVPQPVMLGFINGLALVIAVAQLENFRAASGAWLAAPEMTIMLSLTALTMAIIAIWERVSKSIPAALVSIVVVSGVVSLTGILTPTVGDLATLSGTLPSLHLPQVPLTWSSFTTILPFSLSVAAVGLIEALLVQQLVDELTETRTQTHVECIGQGIAQVHTSKVDTWSLHGNQGSCCVFSACDGVHSSRPSFVSRHPLGHMHEVDL
jgi:sulfate permease, SulP family